MSSSGQIEFHSKLGKTLLKLSGKDICEGGIQDGNKIILWDEIDTLFIEGTRHSAMGITAGEKMTVYINSMKGQKVELKEKTFLGIKTNGRGNIYDAYHFIVSKIIKRQLTKLINDIESGERVSFKSFDITKDAIDRKRPASSYNVVGFHRITGGSFDKGEFSIKFYDDNGHIITKHLGYVNEVPNVHLATEFLLFIAEKNLKSMGK